MDEINPIRFDGDKLTVKELNAFFKEIETSIMPMFGISELGKSVVNTVNPRTEEGDKVEVEEKLIVVRCLDNSGFESFVDVGAEYRAKMKLSDDGDYMAVEDRFGNFRAFRKTRFQTLES